MESKELMIGDWVSSPYGNIQVKFIYNNGYDDVVGEHEEMYLDWYTGEEDPRMKDITIEMVEPIPLTEDILLKNGFQLIKPRIACNFNYVHEFQHLLRLCGLYDLAN